VLVSLGGDIACAGEPPQDGWAVRVAEWHASPDEADGQTILLHGGSLATSSTTVRHWRRGADDVHHLIDPVSGRPASGPWRTVTVAAASCVQANVATTAAIVRGERGRSWLESLNVPARLVHQDGHVVQIGDWPREVPI
jgi:thiamine biosynthesis lipoprotein